MEFKKMQGAGNDFLLFDGLKNKYTDYSRMAKELCNRRYGVGGDGIMIAEESKIADVKMVYYNSDGSRGEMCGNGIRCFSKFVYEKGIAVKEKMNIETGDGIKIAYLKINNGIVEEITISMGKARLKAKDIPVISEKEIVLNEYMCVGGKEIQFSTVLLGVPHAVIIVDDLEKIDVNGLGEVIEKMDIFPKKINVNFIQVLSRDKIKIKTWERGAGRTLACGTGSCSAAYIANYFELINKDVVVETEGGLLKIKIEKDEIFMTGLAENVFDGVVKWD